MTDPLRQSVLVLNKNYQPIDVYTVEEALISVYKGKSEIIDIDYQSYNIMQWASCPSTLTHQVIRTVSHQFALPEVVRLVEFDEHIVRGEITHTRHNVFYRDNYTCQYCGSKCARSDLTIDHVIPKSRRKEFNLTIEEIGAWNNVVCACQECNVTKGNRTPEEAHMPLLSRPIQPTWIGKVHGVNPSNMKPSWKFFLKESQK